MEILAIQDPKEPIGIKTNIRICPHCQAVLKFDYQDMWTKNILGHEINYITCRSCGKDMTVSEVIR